ncbi:hypothetical protein COO60DRAFT_1213535 [Scenedesmus sp. NREL 46B-D3]|nr:hypothetical protein COO60DRAFT_1213535 [Scenedesmus sp. NREL 46B-D3]
MSPGCSDSPRAEAASAQQGVCAPDCASPKATSSNYACSSPHRDNNEQQNHLNSQMRRRRRGPVHAARAISSTVHRTISKRQQQLQHLEKDLLCLRIFKELLPDQLVDEVRQQLQSGAGHATAVQQVAKKRLTGLPGAGVRKLFIALAGTLSASCAAVHVAKGAVCRAARPLRLGRPARLLAGPVLMPTSLYGPLLGAYVVTLAARGALRRMALEVQQERQKQHDAGASGDGAAAAPAGRPEAAPGDDSEEGADPAAGSSASTARRIAMYQQAVRTSSKSMADSAAQPLSKVCAGKGSASSSSTSSSPRVVPSPGQQQQQQHLQSKGKPWWALWKRSKQQQQQQQQQTEDGSGTAASTNSSATCAAAAPHSSSSRSSSPQAALSVARCPSLPPTPGRQDTAAGLATLALAAASASPAAASPRSVNSCSSSSSVLHDNCSSTGTAVPPSPAAGHQCAVLRSALPPQQLVEELHVPAADVNSSSSAPQQQPAVVHAHSPRAPSRLATAAAAAAAPTGVSDESQQQPSSEQPSSATTTMQTTALISAWVQIGGSSSSSS